MLWKSDNVNCQEYIYIYIAANLGLPMLRKITIIMEMDMYQISLHSRVS